MDLKGKNAVVTGGAIRVGRAITLALAGEGCNVLIHYGRSEKEAEATRKETEELGVKAITHSADLADPGAVRGVIKEGASSLGPIDILINSAAIFLDGGLDETSDSMWDQQFAVNLKAPFLLSQEFIRQLPGENHGRIVNIVDARILRPGTDHFAYRLTKAALATMTRNLALDLAPRVTVNAVALGAIMAPPGNDQAYLEKLARTRVPLGRAGNPSLVSQNVLHLLTSDFLTGVIIPLDGGEFL